MAYRFRKATQIGAAVVTASLVFGIAEGQFSAIIFWVYFFGFAAVGVCLIGLDFKMLAAFQYRERAKQSARSRPERLWASVGSALGTIATSFSWPAQVSLLIYAVRAVVKRRKIALRSMMGIQAVVSQASEVEAFYNSITLAVMTAVWYLLLTAIPLTSAYALRMMYFPLFAVISSHLVSMWTSGGLVAGFKRQAGSPLLKFVVVGLCDISVLILSLTVIRNWPAPPNYAKLIITGKELFTLNSVATHAVSDGVASTIKYIHTLRGTETLLFIAGCLMYLVIVRTASNGFDQFKRIDEDYYAVSQLLTTKGDFEGALKQLDKTQNNAKSQELRILPLLSVNNVEKAAKCAWWMLEFDHTINLAQITNEDVYFELVGRSLFLGADARFQVWYNAVVHETAESFLMLMLIILKGDSQTRELIIARGVTPRLEMAFATASLFEQGRRETIDDWFPEISFARSEDMFAHRCLRCLASTLFIESKQDARDLLDELSNWESGRIALLAEQLLSGSTWMQVLVTLLSLEMFRIADQAESSHAGWWRDIGERGGITLNKSPKLQGFGDLMKGIIAGTADTSRWIHPAPGSVRSASAAK